MPTAAAWPFLVILHLLVYPSSNGFNSYMDRDEGSIGGIEHPSAVPPQMYALTWAMDALALLLTWAAYNETTMGLLFAYILASRAYSSRSIRLKKYPFLGYGIVVVFQGAWIFAMTCWTLSDPLTWDVATWLGGLASLALLGASYPLTQIYQHEQDMRDGVKTLSYVLGVRGTFVFSMTMFAVFLGLMFGYLLTEQWGWMWAWGLLLAMSPAAIHLVTWCKAAWQDPREANYKNTMVMSTRGALCTNAYFASMLLMSWMN